MASTRDRGAWCGGRGPLLFAAAAAVVAVAPLVESCRTTTGTDVGNGVVISLNMTAYEAAPAAGAKSIQLSTGVTVDELWVVTSKLRFRQGTDCSADEAAIDDPGPRVADLAGPGFVGGAIDVKRETGPYCRLRLEFDPIKADSLPAGAPAELADASVLMRGHRSDGTPFLVRSKMSGEFRLDPKGASFDIVEGQSALVIGFEIGKVTSALGLDSLGGNPIQIDDQNNQDALKAFEDALKASGGLFRDGNDDGTLEPGERASGQEIAQGQP